MLCLRIYAASSEMLSAGTWDSCIQVLGLADSREQTIVPDAQIMLGRDFGRTKNFARFKI